MKTMVFGILAALALAACGERPVPAPAAQEIPGVTTLETPAESAPAPAAQTPEVPDLALATAEPTPAPAPSPAPLLVAVTPGGGSIPEAPQEEGVVRMDSGLSHPKILAGGQREVWVALSIDADDVRPAQRLPLNVALVIDRSGSMAGKKLRDVQAAAIGLVDVLSPDDRISIVSYADNPKLDVASTLAGERPRRGIEKSIKRMRAAGNTNLSAGLMTGRWQLQPWVRRNQVNRVILLSDGIANRGIVQPEQLDAHARAMSQDGVLVSTIGVGDDYNEDLMTSLADYGGGTYSYVRRSEEVAGAIQREAAMMASTVAQRMTLSIDLEPGVQVTNLYGYRSQTEGSTVVVPLAEAFAGQQRNVLLALRVPAYHEGPVAIGRVTLSYEDMSGAETAHRHRTATLEAWATRDVGEVERSIDDGVMARVEEIRIADAMNEAARAITKGDRVRAKAVLQDARDTASRANGKYKSGRLGGAIGAASGLIDALDEPAAFPAAAKSLNKAAKARSYELTK